MEDREKLRLAIGEAPSTARKQYSTVEERTAVSDRDGVASGIEGCAVCDYRLSAGEGRGDEDDAQY
jgi:hypothetical protein